MSKLSQEEIALLYLFAAQLGSMSGINGTKVYGGTGANTGLSIKALSVREDATAFTTLTMTGGPGGNLDKNYFIVGGATLLRGDLLVAPTGYIITAFELSAGSVLASLF